jgi:hypothetical protein
LSTGTTMCVACPTMGATPMATPSATMAAPTSERELMVIGFLL